MLFRVGLSMFALNQKSLRDIQSTEELMLFCRAMPATFKDANVLFDHAYSHYKISDNKLKELRHQALAIVEEKYRAKHAHLNSIERAMTNDT